MEIAVGVVDDHPAIALAIRAAIASEAGRMGSMPVRYAGAARNLDQALELIGGADRPDVLLCDIQLQSGLDGLEVVEAAHAAGLRTIVLTSFDRSSLMRAAFERGASGFLLKAVEPAEILAAVRSVAAGHTAFAAAALDAARFAPRPPSQREIEVIRGVQQGSTSEEIAFGMSISVRTVESHLRRLFDRYGVVSRAELAVLALNEGWVESRG